MVDTRSSELRCWLTLEDGTRLRVGPAGVLLGRLADCDVVLDEPRASRRQALIRLSLDGADLIPMGANPVEVNGGVAAMATRLIDGDRVTMPGGVFTVAVERTQAEPEPAAPGWILARDGGGRFGLSRFPFTIGGGADDDIVVARWPREALHFFVAQGSLLIETGIEITLGSEPLAVEAVERLQVGDRIAADGEVFLVDTAGDVSAEQSTISDGDATPPRAVTLQFLPRGGRLFLEFRNGAKSTYLADRRCDLVAALLQPPRPLAAGDFVPDELLGPLVWPAKDDRDRTDLNVLVYRVRKDLAKAGIDGARLLQRSPGGGATRFCVAPSAVVTVRAD